MNPSFWAGKRVFLTGHTGFKGGWLALWLQRMGAEVHGYSLEPPTTPNLFSIAQVGKAMSHQIGDIRDLAAMSAALKAFAPDVVFHLAAQPIVRESYAIPVETYETNVMGTVNLLEAVRGTPSVRATVIITSDKCYENREVIWPYREYDAMGGHDPYSSSKGAAEIVTAAYGRSYFSPEMGKGSVSSVRAGNVIGGGDWAKDRLMADLMRGLMAGEDVIIRRPHSVRPWQHVLEPLSGYLEVAEHLCVAGPLAWEGWNFGPEEDSNRTVAQFAELTCQLWGNPGALKIQPDPNAVHEAGLLKLDSTKAKVHLHWRPRWDFEACIARTVEWYRAFKDGADMREVTLQQIAAYERGHSK
ncbi:CDP-glucose 4,6-dehydratase [Rhizomicrobium palustre]|uniref:CDP-glucose 4,6-dehydratase n=1 Tax=Rhizomicrobium palustre TaxID=189966 RepID=A0A846MV68_9PROT|nr:CDP-glucose 4,6-dehydratase [Rhizomicrobium palustre]NIK86907.1 CDP-glucose 4,6-dehydratase [Rhizomicrobium palustre]